MSHIRDLQRLRDSRGSSTFRSTNAFSDIKASKFKPPERAELLDSLKQYKSKELHNNFMEPRKTHRKGLSINGFTYKQPQQSPGLSIYNYSLKMPRRDSQISTPFSTSRNEHKQQVITKNSFKMEYVIGKGGFGKVWKVSLKKDSRVFAMKEMYKSKIIEKKSINSVMNQRTLLAKLKHPFIVNMSYAFQDRQNLYLIIDFLNGGDLRYHIGKRRRFTETETKFFIVCILIGLHYLHSNNVIHRDIKPQNIVMESNGYLRITDLGVSRQFREDNASDTSGTPGYMAPEVMCRKNHSYPADFFAVGVMAYEFMLGRRPYQGKNRKEIRDNILAKQVVIRADDIPKNWSPEAVDFINQLLVRNPNNRLGNYGFEEVKVHPWLRNVDWGRMLKKQIRAPYIPISIEDNYQEYKGQISEDTLIENLQQNALMLRDPEVQNLFDGYSYDIFNRNTKSTAHTANSQDMVYSLTSSKYFSR